MDFADHVISGDDTVDDVLEHFGVKGMHWGVRKSDPGASGPSDVVVRTRAGKKVKTSGGERHSPSDDAIRTSIVRQKAKKSTTHSLSNQELQDLVNRLNLEQQYERLVPKSGSAAAASWVSKTLLGIGKEEAAKLARSTISSQIAGALKKS